jgi:substrate import-associated zinc metallohydrolase lipoprotein
MNEYAPRVILLIGSPALSPRSGTMILGQAEGSVKITLFLVNYIDVTDIEMLNEYYFKTMHHEFAHILHQTKPYPNKEDERREARNPPDPSPPAAGGVACRLPQRSGSKAAKRA